jgi:flagellar motor switch protein FliN/FliY
MNLTDTIVDHEALKGVGATRSTDPTPNIDGVMRIPVTVQVVLGSATMPVANLLRLGRGAVVALDHRVGEPVDVVVNGRVIARGEVVVVEEDSARFGVSLTEIVGSSGDERVS